MGDHKELSANAEKLIQDAKPAILLETDIIVAEIVVYVLRGSGRDRQQTIEALLLIGRTSALKYENDELVMNIIRLLTELKLDFADCYLLARARREKVGLETFDQPLREAYISS